jgi:hypothetical protein
MAGCADGRVRRVVNGIHRLCLPVATISSEQLGVSRLHRTRAPHSEQHDPNERGIGLLTTHPHYSPLVPLGHLSASASAFTGASVRTRLHCSGAILRAQ